MYICEYGHTFDIPDIVQGDRGECWGVPVTADEYVCPECGCSEYYEATKCEICGEVIAEDEATLGVCIKCVVEEMNYKTAMEYIEECGIEDFYEFLANKTKERNGKK